jgi:hydroxymethylbilane synthase
MLRSTWIRIGTRGSRLALVQAKEIADSIENIAQTNGSNIKCIIVPIRTTGDIINDKPLTDIGGKALFLKEIEESLLATTIDIAVHSLKDVPADLPKGLIIPAVTKCSNQLDAFISHKYKGLDSISENVSTHVPLIGTCSSRRKALLQHFFQSKSSTIYPQIVDLRGNVETRLKKLHNGEVDAIVLAVAGLHRLDLCKYITEVMSPNIMLPAIGQGIIAIECRNDDSKILNILKHVNHIKTYICICAERGFMWGIGGSCNTPIAANAQISFIDSNAILNLDALFATPDGRRIFSTNKQYKYNIAMTKTLTYQTEVEVQDKNMLSEIKQIAINVGLDAAKVVKKDIYKSEYAQVLNVLCQWNV